MHESIAREGIHLTLDHQPLFAESYLRAEFGNEFEAFCGSEEERSLLERLRIWSERELQNETSAENAFIDRFFKQLWGYVSSGERDAQEGYTCYPKFSVGRAGASGGTGQADLALGVFGLQALPPIPQALCEFKDIRSGLDTPQRRKNDTRSPVRQCADYLREAAAPLFGNEPVQPHWGIVTDMNEFRLYRRITMPTQYQRFVIAPRTGDEAVSLLEDSGEASFQRLLFARLFHSERFISRGGDPPLINDLKRQFTHEETLEKSFYQEYRAYRERLVETLRFHNPHFPGTPGRLVRLAQTVLDRCIFVLFCEDMGRSLSFPPALLRDLLIERSLNNFYDPGGEEIWTSLQRLFSVMNSGGQFLDYPINRFNGGLFAVDAELDSLHIPNRVFCEKNQGTSVENIGEFKCTLLYFSATYNFGKDSDGNAITLYTLGRIFEQSITELEALEADADNRPSLTKITKRKRDGVYYTPEWVVARIVEETLGARLADLRRDAGWDEGLVFDPADVRRQSASVRRQIAVIDAYLRVLDDIKVVDPACGSGAFLIHALEYLLRERRRVGAERERLSQSAILFDQEQAIRDILSRNIYGVDINPASVEIARLALWLHTARADRPLCDLDRNVRDGNSLIDPEAFREWNIQMDLLPPEERERVNPFDWRESFPEVFDRGGFDCVVGNPPYVKLQHFRRVMPQVAEFLRESRRLDGSALFRSAQTGNFDIFLPFIEKGISLLNESGRMGFIAPSLWLLNEYGAALREFVRSGQNLDRWIDFKSFQVFEEAITYTALQFFTRQANTAVRFAFAPDGAVATDWSDPVWEMAYDEIPNVGDTWVLLPERERRFVQRLVRDCQKLGDLADIIVGIQTSADKIYHLKRNGPGLYESRASGQPVQIEIEDAMMRPLISGTETDRYVDLATETYLLFPYEIDQREAGLISPAQMEREFPFAWRYFKSHEAELRARDSGRNDSDDRWWGYVYPKNLDKQHLPKLAIPRLVLDLFCSIDREGLFFLDNVDVGGALFPNEPEMVYVAALLNSPVLNFVWRRLSKPFQSDYRSANKQFIAPLPIPNALPEQKAWIGTRTLELQRLYTELRGMEREAQYRLEVCDVERRTEDWVLPGVGSLEDWKRRAPRNLTARDRRRWAKENRSKQLDSVLGSLQMRLNALGQFRVQFTNGEFLVERNGVVVLDHVFVTREEGPYLQAQWELALSRIRANGNPSASGFVDSLRRIRTSENEVLKAQVVQLTKKASSLRAAINAVEGELNEHIFSLYNLTSEEREMVEHS